MVLVLGELKVAVTPAGRPDVASATLPLNPYTPVTLIVLLALAPPTSRVRLDAEDERVKLGTGMVSKMLMELVALPEVPVTVIGYVPGATVVLALKVRFVVLPLTAAKVVVTPPGTPDAVRLTRLTRPIGFVTVIAIGRFQAFSPTRRLKLLAEDESVKLGAGLVFGAAMAGKLEAAPNIKASQVNWRDVNNEGP